MHPKRARRLLFIILLMLSTTAAVSLVLYALRQNINLFFTPSEISQGTAPIGPRIRMGGMVQKGSIQRQENLKVHFIVYDFKATVTVEYRGILPDLFREGQGMVAQGTLKPDGKFMADEILAKHDENYMPPEMNTLKQASNAVEP
jgi:cytochrome c-type biogenesis protein CcmE